MINKLIEISESELLAIDRLLKIVGDIFGQLEDDTATVGIVAVSDYDALAEAAGVVNGKLRPNGR